MSWTTIRVQKEKKKLKFIDTLKVNSSESELLCPPGLAHLFLSLFSVDVNVCCVSEWTYEGRDLS